MAETSVWKGNNEPMIEVEVKLDMEQVNAKVLSLIEIEDQLMMCVIVEE